ncbi:uncharacterized protein BO95DRAFT_356743 [Aspergillus brunneoviolaceus CBS 621.78]|uniref:Rhodopsin domain-containing protein n=2 Tax=Aspergillus TaxID=5052 RepID=A0A8G1RWY5_9EURO|nr:hypothetical protein BO95DRAFT_356743 [Aspergillus brunneoviolaceus CBS 621.78]XP_040804424.1 uncharacterized protein BO72DRAFT_493354 [Aspergillus fijiensis CBS 313.89]RAH48502.1 hypothetical protein BO95DRAFT_356743 [Aspergillus brunneoviolaceus CBS 621.78]RAK80414.1 hypothetical protein BO72DRAFT_493354 [Aspergillus fijiensis CBS 313.89]
MTESYLFHVSRSEDTANGSYLSSRGAQALSVSVVFTTLATLFVSARIYTRKTLMNRMEPNDWMILIALVLSFVFMALFIVEALNGMGMRQVDIPPLILEKQMKAFWLTIPFYNAALLCAKASILMQYFRVFPTRRMRRICWLMIAVLATYGTWAVLSAFLNCVPVAKFWDPSIPGFCLSSEGLWFSNASMHITTDLVILIIPIPALMALELPKKQKIALISIFAIGGFVCVTSICRLVALKKIADSSDPTYDNVGAASWSAIECNTGIICACLPTLRPLVSRILPHLLSTLSGGRQAYGTSPLSGAQAPTYWNGTGATVTTTITTHLDDLEYAHCAGDADRYLTLVPGNDVNGQGKLMVRETHHPAGGGGAGDLKEALAREEQRGDSSSSSSPPRGAGNLLG